MHKPLFVYGSMRDPEVLAVVLGRCTGSERARIAWMPDRRTVSLPDETYPVLVEAPGERTEGLLIDALDAHDQARIRFFESAEYRLFEGDVEFACGECVRALFWGPAEPLADAISPWSFAAWQAAHKAAFLHMARRYMALYGQATAAEAETLWTELRDG